MLIDAQSVHKVYLNGRQELPVLKSINFYLNKGEVAAIIGPSGAGKSTLLHILGGLDIPTSGKVFFDGIDIYATGDRERSRIRNKAIGFVFQSYHLLPEFNALENVVMPALISGSASHRVVRERGIRLLEMVGLGRRVGHRPSELSGGEMQRVAIARALMNEPEVVFCDEPTGNLDSKNSELVLELIRDLNKNKGQTFLIVTHNNKLATFSNRISYIRDGLLNEGE